MSEQGSRRLRGLSWNKTHQAWRVRIYFHGKLRFVGRFEDAIVAAQHYDKAAMYLYGTNAITNFGLDACMADTTTPVGACIVQAKQEADAAARQQAEQQQQQHCQDQQRQKQLPSHDTTANNSGSFGSVQPLAADWRGHDGCGAPLQQQASGLELLLALQQQQQQPQVPAQHTVWQLPCLLPSSGAGSIALSGGCAAPSTPLAAPAGSALHFGSSLGCSSMQQQPQPQQLYHQLSWSGQATAEQLQLAELLDQQRLQLLQLQMQQQSSHLRQVQQQQEATQQLEAEQLLLKLRSLSMQDAAAASACAEAAANAAAAASGSTGLAQQAAQLLHVAAAGSGCSFAQAQPPPLAACRLLQSQHAHPSLAAGVCQAGGSGCSSPVTPPLMADGIAWLRAVQLQQ